MFALGLLVVLIAFFLLLTFVSRLFPSGLPRVTFVSAVLAGIAAYPFLYRLSPSYHSFLRLCEQPDRLQIVRRQPVDFIYLDWGFASDCSKGPNLIEGRSYLGFDCLRAEPSGPKLYRYTKSASWQPGCGLGCFESTPVSQAEASYKGEYRSGYMEEDRPVVTYFQGIVNKERDSKFVFHDRVLWGAGEMAYAREYTYYPYGNGWAKLLGLASGSAPALSCGKRLIEIDARDVFPPKSGA